MAAALFGTATLARAESGAFIGGGRLALNYSTLFANTTYGNYTAGYGGLGFEGGVVGRLALVEGQTGLHIGANFIYRSVYNYYHNWYYDYDFTSSEMTVAVPVLFEINPFVLSGLNSSIYEMIFIQIGLQADYSISYSEYHNGRSVSNWFDRENFGIGAVLGAVGYFNSYLSLDVRYYFGFINYYNGYSNWFPYTYSIGLSFYL
jgi:hypothetical protein